ncbi:leader peptidase HopD [Enterobacter sp. BIGb0383]|nr:leader peptidase HopD [Enterobacter sp. BIGb0383]ROS00430.1 leader peptidase HopD [Enterobacter sp. BIGb0359]
MFPDLCFFFLYLIFCLLLCRQDIAYGLLPDRFTCPLLWSGLLWHLCCRPQRLDAAVWGAIAGYAGLAFIYWAYRLLRRREGLGYGDVKFLAALGAWHGWALLPQLVVIATLLAGMLLAFRLCWRGKLETLKNPLPFGPFLAAAGLLTLGQTVSGTPFTLL